MKKKEYERPTMQVFELKQQTQLLAGSTTGNMNDPADYNDGGDPFQFAPQLPGEPNPFDF